MKHPAGKRFFSHSTTSNTINSPPSSASALLIVILAKAGIQLNLKKPLLYEKCTPTAKPFLCLETGTLNIRNIADWVNCSLKKRKKSPKKSSARAESPSSPASASADITRD